MMYRRYKNDNYALTKVVTLHWREREAFTHYHPRLGRTVINFNSLANWVHVQLGSCIDLNK
jgi:hypothetical protein